MKKNFFLFSVFIGIAGFLLLSAYLLSINGQMVQVKETKGMDLHSNKRETRSADVVRTDLNFGKFPLYFITNKGQVNKKAKFYAKASKYTLWLTKEGLVFDSMRMQSAKRRAQSEGIKALSSKSKAHIPEIIEKASGLRCAPDAVRYAIPHTVERDVSRLMFIGANKNPEMVPINKAKLNVNYFIGNDRSKWHCDVPTSLAVLYKNLYKNIDLKVYGIEKQIEYDWIVKPGGNPADIKFEYRNVLRTRIDEEGNLVIGTEVGELIHKKPFSYQLVKAKRQKGNMEKRGMVNVKFKKISKNTYGLAVDNYDKSRELIIDPVVLAYSTYLGGENTELGHGIAVDSSGYAYVGGLTWSTNFPTLNPYQSDQSSLDVFITKIDTTQSGTFSLVYSTYLGGGSDDSGIDLAVDSSGNAYMTGLTHSTDFPTLNQYQSTSHGLSDAFVTKIDTTQVGASSLVYSTYLGGSSHDTGSGITVDHSGNAFLSGSTYSSDFPILNQYQTDQPGEDAFVTKIDTTQAGASSLVYSTYLGGSSWDSSYGIAVDSSENVYVTGETYSSDFPILDQFQVYQTNMDVFVTKIDTTKAGASSLIYSTYLGGNGDDTGQNIAVDSSGNVYVTGETSSPDFPILDQFQEYQAYDDIFVTKLDTTRAGAASLIYSTYLGGSSYDTGCGIAIDSRGDAYITGETYSSDFPVLNQFQMDQPSRDAFVTKMVFAPVPKVTTTPAVDITPISAVSGGDVRNDGGTEVTVRGVCWSTSPRPTLLDFHTTDGSGTGKFTSYITGLSQNTTYYVRAYATNSAGTGYGRILSFRTLSNPRISGTAVASNGKGVEDVSLYFSNNGGTAITDQHGHYSHSVAYNWSGTVTPKKSGYIFIPAKRIYDKVTSDFTNQDYTACYIVLILHASRENESAWLISRQYGKIELEVENPGDITVAKYVIYRKEAGGNYSHLIEIPSSQLQGDSYLYFDKYLDKAKSYTYKSKAVDAQGMTIGVSNEKTI